MREPPEHVSDVEVLAAVRAQWAPDADTVEHLPVGFGAHHWAAGTNSRRTLFVTFDSLSSHHSPASLEAAYASAAALADRGLDFVHASLPSATGAFTVPVDRGALSATLWLDGSSGDGPYPDADAADAAARRLARLHATEAPASTRRWQPLVDAGLADDLAHRTVAPWESGPYGERARLAVRERLDDIARWTARYNALVDRVDPDAWCPTHGEPHSRNELHTASGVLLVDWESLQLAPRERDFATLLEGGVGWVGSYGREPDWPMVELFHLQWRLSEADGYADWFRAEHRGSESDRVAIGGLLEELARPEWQRP